MRLYYSAVLCAAALLATAAADSKAPKAAGGEKAPKATAPAVSETTIALTVTGMR